MLLDYYKLTEQPFGVTPDSRFLYLGPKHREALASLLYGTEANRGFLALIAEPGMGKTTLLYHYLSYLRGKARTAFVFRTDCDSRDFIRHVLLDLGEDISAMDLPAMHEALNRILTEEMKAGRRFVLVVDEAQNLEEKVLESIRLLSNFETPVAKLMHIVLAGQPQLADKLASRSLAQLRQRVSMVIPIERFTEEEVNAYIDHRLWIAGNDKRQIFTPGARRLIAEHSEGIPRNINNLCFHSMSLGCALKRETIDRDLVQHSIADLDLEHLRAKPAAAPARPSPAVVSTSTLSLTSAAAAPPAHSRWTPRAAVAAAALVLLGWPLLRVTRGLTLPSSWHSSHASQAAPSVKPAAAGFALPTPATAPAAAANAAPENASPAASASPTPSPALGVVAELAPPSPASVPTTSVKVKPGETLFQISVNEFGRYDPTLVSQIQALNPWLTDPDHIQSGRTILVPSAEVIPSNVSRAAGPSASVPPAKAGKP